MGRGTRNRAIDSEARPQFMPTDAGIRRLTGLIGVRGDEPER